MKVRLRNPERVEQVAGPTLCRTRDRVLATIEQGKDLVHTT